MIKQSKLHDKVFGLIRKKDFLTALELIEQERVNARNSSFYYALYGIIHIYMDRFHEAKLFLNKAIAINPNDTTALNGLAFVLLREGKLNDAIRLYISILSINPEHPIAKKNLNKFKSQKGSEKALQSLNPNHYLKRKVSYSSKYQKIAFYALSIVFVLLLAYKLYMTGYFSLDKNQIFILRDHYKQKLYITHKEIENKLDVIISDHSNKLKLLAFNGLLVSKLHANQKIKLEHRYRNQYLLTHQIRPERLEEVGLKRIIAFPQKYHGLPVQLAGFIRFKEKTNSYSLKTTAGIKLTLIDSKKLLKNTVSVKKVQVIASVNSLNDRLVFDIIKIE
ncbi:MAG: hypothetical protein IEMM0008_0328 [bacterium]|nr:MAG: hypothetical protein IEMM0008_0328 [bacterium]